MKMSDHKGSGNEVKTVDEEIEARIYATPWNTWGDVAAAIRTLQQKGEFSSPSLHLRSVTRFKS